MKGKIYVILLNYNGWKDTIECLESVLKNDYKSYQVIVVDNNSKNNSIDCIVSWAKGEREVIYDKNSKLKHLGLPPESKPLEYVFYSKNEALNGGNKKKELELNSPIVFIQSGKNEGFSAGNNIGIKYALAKDDFKYIWLLNNDTVVKSNTLSLLENSFEKISKSERLGVLGLVQYYYHEPEKIQAAAGGFNKWSGSFWNYQTLNFNQNDVAYIYGASMFVKKEVFKEVGLLNENYFMYYEEIDFAERLKQYKYTQQVDKSIQIFHKHGSTTATLDSDFRIYYLEKNKIKFYKTYYMYLVVIPIIKLIKNYILNRFKKVYIKALRDGMTS
jgi:GT2 family glycosyltransferase